MTDYSKIAASDIRSYIWNEIVDAGLLDPNDYFADGFYENMVPIIPSQQIPEFNNLLPGKTYMIYDFEIKTIPVQWWMTEESFTISTISQNYDVINQINNLINDLFRRYDESATDLNTYLAGQSNFIYHHAMIDRVFSPEPYNTEGDYQIGSAMISYGYSRITDEKGRF